MQRAEEVRERCRAFAVVTIQGGRQTSARRCRQNSRCDAPAEHRFEIPQQPGSRMDVQPSARSGELFLHYDSRPPAEYEAAYHAQADVA